MTEKPDPEAWRDTMTGRERVRRVVELLEEPATVTDIKNQADVAWETANSELEQMVEENRVVEIQMDGETRYTLNQVEQLFDQLKELIVDNERNELEERLYEYQTQVDQLRQEFEVESIDELRRHLADGELSAEEMQQLRNAISTWEALETELRLHRQAIHLYDDVQYLSHENAEVSIES